jgi:hypothetical protein
MTPKNKLLIAAVVVESFLLLALFVTGQARSATVPLCGYTPCPPTPTPESGIRNCAISALVGYRMDNEDWQFYVAGQNGQSTKLLNIPKAMIDELIATPAGAVTTLPTSTGQVITFTHRGAGIIDVAYDGYKTTCS